MGLPIRFEDLVRVEDSIEKRTKKKWSARNQICFQKTVSNDMEIQRCQELGGINELSNDKFVEITDE